MLTILSSELLTKTQINKINFTFSFLYLLFSHHEITGLNISIQPSKLMQLENCFESVVHDNEKNILRKFVFQLDVDEILE